MIPFRLRVLQALTTCLEGINPDDPDHTWAHDLRGCVFRGRNRYGESDPLPLISILEPPIPKDTLVSKATNTASAGPWELLIQGFVRDDYANPSDPAHVLMAEVKSKLVLEKRRERGRNVLGMNGRVAELYIGQGSVRPPDEVSDKAFFWLTLTLHLVENLENPYE